MALNDISLTAGMRSNLLALQGTASMLDRTQSRLSTGKKVNTALDNPTNFFSAQANTQRATDLSTRKDAMSEAVQGVQAANQGITGITALIEAAKGLTQAAQSADTTNRNALATQFNTVLTQLTQLATDSTYKGKNFVTGDTLTVLFNENGTSNLAISGFSGTATGLSITAVQIASGGSISSQTGVAVATGSSVFTLSTTNLTHTGTAVAASADPNYVAAQTIFITGGAMTGTFISGQGGITLNLSGISGVGATLASGMVTINAISIGGTQLSLADVALVQTGTVSGVSGGIFTPTFAGVAGLSGALVTGQVVVFQVTIAAHMMTGSAPAPAGNLFDLAGTDKVSGLSVHTATGAASGVNVYISGIYVAKTNYTLLSGTGAGGADQIRFNSGVVPPGGVTYDYNSGVLAGQASGSTVYAATGAITLATGQTLTSIVVGGTTYATGFVATTSGSSVSIQLTGALLSGAAIAGSVITANTTTTVNAQAGGWDDLSGTGIQKSVDQLNTAVNTLRSASANLASNLNVVTVRQDFTNGMVATLQKGADNLTLADMNEEGANMLMLQTRQQLGTTSLKMASDAAQSVLRLF